MIRPPPKSTLFPSTPLFRSRLMGGGPPPRRPAGPIPHTERVAHGRSRGRLDRARFPRHAAGARGGAARPDRKSTRLNSSHLVISYAVFCLKKKKKSNNHW